MKPVVNLTRWRSSWIHIVHIGLYFLIATNAMADKVIRTPDGEEVVLKHVHIHAGINSDYYEYTNREGERIRHGEHKEIWPGDWIKEVTTYAHGIRHGRFVRRSSEHQLEVEGFYENGVLHGRIQWYYPSGVLRSIENFVQGELSGPYQWFFENGKMREKGTYVEGQRHGSYLENHENGTKYLEGNYKEGRMSGPVQIFNEEGDLAAEGILIEDLILGRWVCYENGKTILNPKCEGKVFMECRCF